MQQPPTDSAAKPMSARLLAGLTTRQGLILLATGLISAGTALNWTGLTAIGVAPILISVLPCLAMCAVGFCMKSGGSNSCRSSDEKSKS